ncbi:MAG: hypothetical protein RBR71_12880 [Gudongella sp.]|nr:hypothetical protein [Gudongella sp.]
MKINKKKSKRKSANVMKKKRKPAFKRYKLYLSSEDATLRGFEFSGNTIINYASTNKIVTIPDKINNMTITSICETTFRDKSLKEIFIPKNIEYIPYDSFLGNPRAKITVDRSNKFYMSWDYKVYNKAGTILISGSHYE